MKYVAATIVGIVTGVCVIATIIFSSSDGLLHTSLVWQEVNVPNAALGFEHSVGYDSEQDFYWDEITHSKTYKIELLKELGRNVGPYGRESGGFLPYLVFKKTIRVGTPQEDDRLFLGIRKQFLQEPLTEVPPNLDEELQAATKVFIRMIGERGVPARKIGTVFLESRQYDTILDAMRRWGTQVVLGTLFSSWLTTFLMSRKKKNPNNPLETTPDGASQF